MTGAFTTFPVILRPYIGTTIRHKWKGKILNLHKVQKVNPKSKWYKTNVQYNNSIKFV